MPLNIINTERIKFTENTQDAADQLLEYLVTHPNATILYHASDTIMHIYIDASYLSVPKERILLGWIF